jgi:hypothetical protein
MKTQQKGNVHEKCSILGSPAALRQESVEVESVVSVHDVRFPSRVLHFRSYS